MDLSAVGRAVLIAREGRRLEAYRDSVGVWTIGIGHTAAAGPPIPRAGLRIDAAEADAVFARDVAAFVRTVAEALPEPLPQHAFDALVSLCFNIGPAAFRRSSVLRRLRAGDRMGAGEAILMWNRPAAVIPRRQGEFDQFRTPYEAALPRARRGDAQPVSTPVSAPVPAARPTVPPAARPSWRARLRDWLARAALTASLRPDQDRSHDVH
ncbi:Lysozyme [Methylorubrum thiocyanatum]